MGARGWAVSASRTEFQFGTMEGALQTVAIRLHNSVNVPGAPELTLHDGQDGELYVLCI